MSFSINSTRSVGSDASWTGTLQRPADNKTTPVFSRPVNVRPDEGRPPVDRMLSSTQAGYEQLLDQDMLAFNDRFIRETCLHLWSSDRLDNVHFPPTPLLVGFNSGGKLHQVYVENGEQGLVFTAPSLRSWGNLLGSTKLAAFKNNTPARYFNGLRPDDLLIAEMMLGLFSALPTTLPGRPAQ